MEDIRYNSLLIIFMLKIAVFTHNLHICHKNSLDIKPSICPTWCITQRLVVNKKRDIQLVMVHGTVVIGIVKDRGGGRGEGREAGGGGCDGAGNKSYGKQKECGREDGGRRRKRDLF